MDRPRSNLRESATLQSDGTAIRPGMAWERGSVGAMGRWSDGEMERLGDGAIGRKGEEIDI